MVANQMWKGRDVHEHLQLIIHASFFFFFLRTGCMPIWKGIYIFFLRVFGRAYIQIHSLDEILFRDLGYELFDHLNKKKVVVRSSWSSTCIAAMHDS